MTALDAERQNRALQMDAAVRASVRQFGQLIARCTTVLRYYAAMTGGTSRSM
jgi:hypothetical protein